MNISILLFYILMSCVLKNNWIIRRIWKFGKNISMLKPTQFILKCLMKNTQYSRRNFHISGYYKWNQLNFYWIPMKYTKMSGGGILIRDCLDQYRRIEMNMNAPIYWIIQFVLSILQNVHLISKFLTNLYKWQSLIIIL